MMLKLHHVSSLVSGVFAALSSMLGKLAFGSKEFENLVLTLMTMIPGTNPVQLQICLWWLMLLLLVLANVAMWVFFSRAMMLSPNTIEVTSVNSVANFLFSTLIGVIIFNEALTISWIAGILLMVMGLLIIHWSKSKDSVGCQHKNKEG